MTNDKQLNQLDNASQEKIIYEHLKNSSMIAARKESDPNHFAIAFTPGMIVTPFEITEYGIERDNCQILYIGDKIGVYEEKAGIYVRPEYDSIDVGDSFDPFVFKKDGVSGWITLEGRFVSFDEMKADPGLTDECYDIGLIGAMPFIDK